MNYLFFYKLIFSNLHIKSLYFSKYIVKSTQVNEKTRNNSFLLICYIFNTFINNYCYLKHCNSPRMVVLDLKCKKVPYFITNSLKI